MARVLAMVSILIVFIPGMLAGQEEPWDRVWTEISPERALPTFDAETYERHPEGARLRVYWDLEAFALEGWEVFHTALVLTEGTRELKTYAVQLIHCAEGALLPLGGAYIDGLEVAFQDLTPREDWESSAIRAQDETAEALSEAFVTSMYDPVEVCRWIGER
jgi:hypothetical protein